MKRRILTILAVIACFCMPVCAQRRVRAASESADLVLRNAVIYTADDRAPRAEALAIKRGKIVYVGSNDGVKSYQSARTKTVDLAGRFVFPGFTDGHCHIMGVGQRELSLNLEGSGSLEAFLARVKERADALRPGEWIVGRGWIETFWSPPVFPTRADLDRVAPKNPVYLTRADGHASVANSLALKMAGVDKNTTNPFGGEILKDATTGEPTGMLIDKAQPLVALYLPKPTPEAYEKALMTGARREVELGWCAIQNAGSAPLDVALMRTLYAAGKLDLRIYNAVYGPGPEANALIQSGPTIGEYGGRFTMRTIKVVMDGALGSRGAALLEPYSDAPTSGFFTSKPDEVLTMLMAALRAGVQVETHAIGDRANREALDLYEKAFAAVPPERRKVREPRWRIEHAQILSSVDLPRFAKLGVIPSMQPSHAIGDLHFAPSRLGVARLAGAYAWKSLLDSGVVIPAGSDAPVERGEPMIEFYAAVARKDLRGFSGDGWHPEQAVSREQALKMLTLWPAIAAFQEKERGSLEAGKQADVTILSANIMEIPEADILKTRCVMTIIGGKIAFDALSAEK
jgi:predicted amidohydrolase YtcJ